MLRPRPYSGHDDLVAMEELQRAAWRRDGPYVTATPGDLHWWMYQHLDKLDEVRIALWEDGRLVGWTWLWLPGALFFHVDPGGDADPLLDWFEHEATTDAEALDVYVLDTRGDLVAALERRGYSRAESDMEHMVAELEQLPTPRPPPEGFELRPTRDAELAERVEAHRAAFAPSRVTVESYAHVRARPPYRPELDWLAVAPDGRGAAFCLVWLDAENAVAEMEPVGTHPDFQRRGLGAAVCLAALGAARDVGARTGLVYANVGSPGAALYASLGFRSIARHVVFRKKTGA